MFVSDCLGIKNGHLTIGGVDTVNIAEKYGTPVYVMDENKIRDNCKSFVNSLKEDYGGNGLIAFASKAFSCKEIYRVINDENMGADVVSAGELYTALSAEFPPEKIIYHGNNKTSYELERILDENVGRIVIDNFPEIEALEQIAAEKRKKINAMIRVKPGIDAHTHDFIKTGQIDSKFGFALETGEALEAAKKITASKFINLTGLHCHIGSQIFDTDPFELAAERLIGLTAQIKAGTGRELTELNIGGGFGIKYTDADNPISLSDYMKKIADAINAECEKLSISKPFLILEPGRSIVASAGITLYTVGSVKHIPGIRTYVAVDGGMCDNPRYILYGAGYDAVCANKAARDKDAVVTIAGRCCESGDLIQENVKLQTVEAGDIIAVLATGAYNYSMAMNYNRVGKAPVVFVKDGKTRLVVKRETPEDMCRNDF